MGHITSHNLQLSKGSRGGRKDLWKNNKAVLEGSKIGKVVWARGSFFHTGNTFLHQEGFLPIQWFEPMTSVKVCGRGWERGFPYHTPCMVATYLQQEIEVPMDYIQATRAWTSLRETLNHSTGASLPNSCRFYVLCSSCWSPFWSSPMYN